MIVRRQRFKQESAEHFRQLKIKTLLTNVLFRAR